MDTKQVTNELSKFSGSYVRIGGREDGVAHAHIVDLRNDTQVIWLHIKTDDIVVDGVPVQSLAVYSDSVARLTWINDGKTLLAESTSGQEVTITFIENEQD